MLHVHQAIGELLLHALALSLLVFGVSLCLELSSLFLLDLLHGLEEELLDVRPLIKDHLSQSFQVDAFLHLESAGLGQTLELFVLFLDDLLVLELDQLSLLFKILHDLTQRRFKQIDFGLQHLDLFVLLVLFDGNLLVALHLLSQLGVQFLVLVRECGGFLSQVLELQLLHESLLLKSVILCLDVSFDLGNVLFSVDLSLDFLLL